MMNIQHELLEKTLNVFLNTTELKSWNYSSISNERIKVSMIFQHGSHLDPKIDTAIFSESHQASYKKKSQAQVKRSKDRYLKWKLDKDTNTNLKIQNYETFQDVEQLEVCANPNIYNNYMYNDHIMHSSSQCYTVEEGKHRTFEKNICEHGEDNSINKSKCFESVTWSNDFHDLLPYEDLLEVNVSQNFYNEDVLSVMNHDEEVFHTLSDSSIVQECYYTAELLFHDVISLETSLESVERIIWKKPKRIFPQKDNLLRFAEIEFSVKHELRTVRKKLIPCIKVFRGRNECCMCRKRLEHYFYWMEIKSMLFCSACYRKGMKIKDNIARIELLEKLDIKDHLSAILELTVKVTKVGQNLLSVEDIT